MLYERILVPFDGSKFAKKALDEAIKIASKYRQCALFVYGNNCQ
ncbi:universal stress protein [Candidatus Nitrosotenuis chungbukensis]|nr:universal stress protein [Candidatus Nitrosotenuis chungbukensis]WKT58656.1 universal stress protein [Candidatus Nitrosotenuis chungbukensis]